ncbi:MAG TPA: hypothetical protein VND94_18830 [Terriglobia bacterium]|nr:hypothetical protein [Terriglobia bacterium]
MRITSRQHTRIKSYELVLTDAALGIEVYSNSAGTVLMGFSGKRNKPDFHYSFNNAPLADKYVSEWHQRLQANHTAKMSRKAERKAYVTALQVDDVLRCSWGYEQTNIDYYQVTRICGRQTIEIRSIAADRVETSNMQGNCWPIPDAFKGPALRCRVDPRGYVSISRREHASLKEPLTTEPTRTYAPDHWTAYA